MFANELDCLLHNFNLPLSRRYDPSQQPSCIDASDALSSVKLDFLAVGSMLIESSIFS